MIKINPKLVRGEILAAGFTIKEVCEVAKVSSVTISKFFSGKSSPKVSTYNKVAGAFNLMKGKADEDFEHSTKVHEKR